MRIKTIKAAINKMFKNEPLYFHDGTVTGQVEKLSICDGAKSYTVELKDGRQRGRMSIASSQTYLFTDRYDYLKF